MSGQNFTTIGEALDYVTRNGYFILEGNDPFEGINADGLVLDVDAAKMSSYPQTGTTWYDLSGNQNSSTLTNGPTFDSNGWLVFDGVDDYSRGSGLLGQDCTVELWISSSNYNGKIPISIDSDSYGSGPNIYCTSNIIAWNTGDGGSNAFSNSSYPNAQWHHIVVTNDYNVTAKLYIDGKLIGTANSLNATTSTANRIWIARFHGDNNYTIAARIKSARIYNASLTEAQVKQNYFGSPIVTDGLVFAVDANNIVSYPKSGTPWYNLTGSYSASLINGPIFDQANGGAISFDGTDEYAAVQYNSALDITTAVTVEAWVKYRSQGEIGGVGRTYSVISYKGYPWTWLLEDQGGQFNFRISTTSVSDSNINSNYYHGLNNWDHVVCTYDGVTQAIYVNGVLKNSQSLTGTINTSATLIELGTYGSGDYSFNGWLANHRIYNRALSASEVQQNYQAEQYRFVTSSGIPTNGLILHLDAANKQSYPGSGTVWYDISGQGANADLVNGVAYNSAGYFYFDGTDDIANSINISQDYRDLVIGIWSESDGGLEMVFSLYGGADASFRLNSNLMFSANNNDDWQFGSNDLVFVDGVYTPDSNLASQFHFVRTYRSNEVDFGTSFRYSLSSTFLSRYFKGKIAFVLCYNRQLSDSEVRSLYYYYKDRFGF
jgi:hypothetical protein